LYSGDAKKKLGVEIKDELNGLLIDDPIANRGDRGASQDGPHGFAQSSLLDEDEKALNGHGQDHDRQKAYGHYSLHIELTSHQRGKSEGQDDEGKDHGQAGNQEKLKLVHPQAKQVSQKHYARKNPQTVVKAGIPEGQGHQDRHENAESGKSDDIPEDGDDEGGDRDQKKNSESLLEFGRKME
jgi:hypothetical protein